MFKKCVLMKENCVIEVITVSQSVVEGHTIVGRSCNSLNGPCGIVVLMGTVIEPLSSKNNISSKTT